MTLLADQDVWAVTIEHLEANGHDIMTAVEAENSGVLDEEVLAAAAREDRILITRDRDFGNLVFLKGLGSGVIYLRILPSTLNAVHRELLRVLSAYSEERLRGCIQSSLWKHFASPDQRHPRAGGDPRGLLPSLDLLR